MNLCALVIGLYIFFSFAIELACLKEEKKKKRKTASAKQNCLKKMSAIEFEA